MACNVLKPIRILIIWKVLTTQLLLTLGSVDMLLLSTLQLLRIEGVHSTMEIHKTNGRPNLRTEWVSTISDNLKDHDVPFGFSMCFFSMVAPQSYPKWSWTEGHEMCCVCVCFPRLEVHTTPIITPRFPIAIHIHRIEHL